MAETGDYRSHQLKLHSKPHWATWNWMDTRDQLKITHQAFTGYKTVDVKSKQHLNRRSILQTMQSDGFSIYRIIFLHTDSNENNSFADYTSQFWSTQVFHNAYEICNGLHFMIYVSSVSQVIASVQCLIVYNVEVTNHNPSLYHKKLIEFHSFQDLFRDLM